MSETKPLDTCSVSKADVTMDHEDTCLDHVIKTEELDLEPDYIECDADEPEITVKDEQMDNCDIKVELNDGKQTVPLSNNTMDIETKPKISQYDNGNSQIYQQIQKREIKLEIETNDETSGYELVGHAKLHDGKGGCLTHPVDKPFTCNICDYECKEKRYLNKHMSTHTDNKPFSCNICNYKCKQKGNLRIHMRTHTADKPFSCNICDFKCKQKGNLTIHMKTHTSDKPFSCETCDYKSKRKASLKLHMMSHTDKKLYSCDICNNKFYQRYKLNLHMKNVHTGDKPHSCDICNYKSSRKDSLNQHMRTHTGVKPHACVQCDYKSAHRKLLVRHMRTHTGEKSPK